MIALLTFILGLVVAFGAHLAARSAERRSKETYHRLTNLPNRPSLDEQTNRTPGNYGRTQEPTLGGKRLKPDISGLNIWEEIRPIVGAWGCLYLGLQFIKGVGILVAALSGLYLILTIYS